MIFFLKKNIYALMFLSMIFWGVAWTSAKIVNEYNIGFYNLVFLRFFFGALALTPLLFFDSKGFRIQLSSLKYIIPSAILFLLYNISFFMGTYYGYAGKGAVFATTTNPIITLIIMIIITQKIKKMEILGIFMGFIGGVIIMDIFNQGIANLITIENIFFPLCSIIWGTMTVLVSYGQKNSNPLQFIFYCYIITTILTLPFTNLGSINTNILDTRFYLNFFIVSIASMSFGTSIYLYSTTLIGPIKSSAFIFSVPFIALSAAHFVLDEPVFFSTIIGGIICLSATYIVNIKKS